MYIELSLICPNNLKFAKRFKYIILSFKMGIPRLRSVDNIRMDLQEVGCGYVDWTGLAQDRERGGRL